MMKLDDYMYEYVTSTSEYWYEPNKWIYDPSRNWSVSILIEHLNTYSWHYKID